MYDLLMALPKAVNAAPIPAGAFRAALAESTPDAWPHDAIEACAIEGATATYVHPTYTLEQVS
jgi:hypothetical protein